MALHRSYVREEHDVLEETVDFGEDEEQAAIPGTSARSVQPKKFHFFPSHDIKLLKQVAATRPYAAPHGQTEAMWNGVAEKLARIGLSVQTRTLRERFNALLSKFRSQETASLRKSGTDEEYDEREQLLTDIVEHMDSLAAAAKQKKERKDKASVSAAHATEMMNAAMRNMRKMRTHLPDSTEEEDDSEISPLRAAKRSRRRTLASVLDDRSKRIQTQNELDRQRLDNESRRIALEESKLQLERDRFEADSKIREIQLNMFGSLVDKLSERK